WISSAARFLRQRLGVGLGRFELPSQALLPHLRGSQSPKDRPSYPTAPDARRTGTRDKYVVAYASRGLRIEENASLAANRTASALVLRGRHPVRSSRSSASRIARTSPAHPRAPPAPPVPAYSTPRTQSYAPLATD